MNRKPVKICALILFGVGIALLALSLPRVWYSDAYGDLRGIDGRYYSDLPVAGSAFLRMLVIAVGAAALFGALATLAGSRIAVGISMFGLVLGGTIFVFGTEGILSEKPLPGYIVEALDLQGGDPRLGSGAYLFASGMLTVALGLLVTLIGLLWQGNSGIEPDIGEQNS